MGRLFWKFFFAFSLALLLMGVGVGATVWLHRQAHEPLNPELAAGPRTALQLRMSAAILANDGAEVLRGVLKSLKREGLPQVYAVDAAGTELLGRAVSPGALAQARELASADREHSPARRVLAADQREYLLFVPADSAPRREPPPPPHRDGPFPLLLIVFGVIASLGFSALLAWYLAKPIRHLRWAFEATAAGKLDTRVAPRMGGRRDEIADLGRDFDHMAQQLQQLVASQRRLLHDVSHELRSPLARLQAAIGLARQQPEKLDATLDRIERESGRLDELVGELLTLARLEAGMSGAPDDYVDLMELVQGVAEDARFEAEAKGRQVLFSGAGEVIVKGRAELLQRAFDNVIRDAVKYTREGTAVEVNVDKQDAYGAYGRLVVTVSDRGPGIAENDLEAVFQPFFRGEAGATTAGFGLGLAIARRAIEAHGGSIRTMNRHDGGLRVEIVVPTNSPSSSQAGGF